MARVILTLTHCVHSLGLLIAGFHRRRRMVLFLFVLRPASRTRATTSDARVLLLVLLLVELQVAAQIRIHYTRGVRGRGQGAFSLDSEKVLRLQSDFFPSIIKI